MKRILFLSLLFILSISFVFAESILNGAITFDVPSVLEIQSGSYLDFKNDMFNAAGITNETSYMKVVLQQKGVNDFTPNSSDKYCRIIIEVTETDSSLSNDANKRIINALTPSDIQEFEETLKSSAKTQEVIDKWYPMERLDFAGCFAVKISYERQSVSGNSNVYVETYSIPSSNCVIKITFSYRITYESYFLPAIEDFKKSLKIDLSKILIESGTKGAVQIIGTSKKVRWPENGQFHYLDDDSEARYYECNYAGDFLTTQLTAVQSTTRFPYTERLQTISVLGLSISSTLKDILNGAGIYNYEMTKKIATSDYVQVEFKFKELGIDCSGVLVFLFADERTFLIFLGLEFGADNPVLDDVLQSVLELT